MNIDLGARFILKIEHSVMDQPSPPLPQVFPELEDWPIYKLSEDRDAFVQELNEFTNNRLHQKPNQVLSDMLAQTIYLERIRIKEEPWKVDPPNEDQFWKRMRKKLITHSLDKNEDEARKVNEAILAKIVKRYAEEIVGTFKIPTFKFARKFLTVFFNRLLNTAAGRNLGRFWGTKRKVSERLKVYGEVEKIRALMKKGTVVLVPTHFSNLDSILIGYALDTVLGLPSFSYGAGLNLYNTGYTAYYMNRLGAYRVDRRKKNPIYLETLKAMSKLSIRRGVNSLFFPGGTRSRSGALETRLKLGLLSTAVEAQRSLYEKEKDEKVFIVPLILGYHFVLEADYLIEQHLKSTGKENYLKLKDHSYSRWKVFKFIWKLFSRKSDIILSFGKPMDVLGNFVDEEGNSFDRKDNPVELKEYFVSDGRVKSDRQREGEYTRILADRIIDRYHKENIVLSSHLIAFVVFTILLKENPKLDLYGVLRLPVKEYEFEYQIVRAALNNLRIHLLEMEQEGKIKLTETIRGDLDELIRDGINNLGIFHPQKPLKINELGHLESENFRVLYYYHNRLSTYSLAQYVEWDHSIAAFAKLTI